MLVFPALIDSLVSNYSKPRGYNLVKVSRKYMTFVGLATLFVFVKEVPASAGFRSILTGVSGKIA